MKILFVGDVSNAASLRQALSRANEHDTIHGTDVIRAIAELLRKRYDWVIIDGPSLLEGKPDITRIIRMMSPEACSNHVAPVQANNDDARSTNYTKCGVEWSKDGILQLHCCLHSLLRINVTPWRPGLSNTGDYVFEYHAPCGKGRRRDG